MSENDKIAQGVMTMYDSLSSEKSTAKRWADYLKPLVCPQSPDKLDVEMNLGDTKINRLYNNKAIDACLALVTAHQTNITPNYLRWFDFSPSKLFGDENINSDEVKKWFRQCTEIAYEELSKTNFYSVHLQASMDKCSFGTGAFYIGVDNKKSLIFKYVPFDSFVIGESNDGLCDTFICVYNMSPNQMASLFAEKNLPHEVIERLNDPCKRFVKSETVLHAVYPRLRYDVTSSKKEDMPFESVYVHKNTSKLIELGGFESMPYVPLRSLKWNDVYGFALGRICLTDIEALQRTERDTQALSTTKTFPRIAAKAKVLKSLNLKPGAGTPLEDMNDIPRTFATEGALMSREDEITRHEEGINRTFYANLVQIFSNTPAGMTATEVNARIDEAVLGFAPMFLQHISDLKLCMVRLFNLLLDCGSFPAMPESVAALFLKNAENMEKRPDPIVDYQSRYAQVLKATNTNGLLNTIQKFAQLAGALPPVGETLERFNFDFAMKEVARADNCPEGFILSDIELEEKTKKKLDDQFAMMQMQQSMQMQGQGGNAEMEGEGAL